MRWSLIIYNTTRYSINNGTNTPKVISISISISKVILVSLSILISI